MISMGYVNSDVQIMELTYLFTALGMMEVLMSNHLIESVTSPEAYNLVKDLMIGIFPPMIWILLQVDTFALKT